MARSRSEKGRLARGDHAGSLVVDAGSVDEEKSKR
jgi:hypothetical protein